MFSAFHKLVFFFPSPHVFEAAVLHMYFVFCFFLTPFKEELANLQHNRQSGAMFQDEKRSLFLHLCGSCFPAPSISTHPGQAGLWGCFQIAANNLFLCKAENENLCLVVELYFLSYKRTQQPANSA